MSNIAIIGADGFIGKNLYEKLIKNENNYIYSFVKNSSLLNSINKNSMIIELEMSDYNKISDILNNIKIDVVYYISWYGGVIPDNLKKEDIQFQNIEIFNKFMKSIIKIKVNKIIFISSDRKYKLIKENYEDVVDSFYGTAKHCCELIGKNISFHNDILFNSVIFSNVFGVGDFSLRSTNIIIRKMLSNLDIDLIDGNILYDWIYIDDAVNGIIKVYEQGKPYSSYYIGSKQIKKFSEIINKVKEVLKSTSELNYSSYKDDFYVDYDKLDYLKIYRDTDFRIESDFEKNIVKTAKWIRENGIGEK